MCLVWIWEQTATISLYNINWLVCITETECVYCAVRTGYLYTIQVNISLSVVNCVQIMLTLRAKLTVWASPSWPTIYPSVSNIQTTLLSSMPLKTTVVLSKQIKQLHTEVRNSTYYCSSEQLHCCLFLGG